MIKAAKIYHENNHHDLKRCFWNWEHLDPFVKEIKERPKIVLYCPSKGLFQGALCSSDK